MWNKYMKILLRDYLIRNWEKEDAPAIAKYANNRKIWLNLRDRFPHPYHLSDAKAFLANVFEQQPLTFFAIANEQEAIGSIGLMLGEDVHRYTAELGYWLAEPFWNKGIMTEVVSKFTDFAFERFELIRIFAEPYINNTASVRVLEKSGWNAPSEKSANSQYARNWLQYPWSMMPPPCRAIAFQPRRTVDHASH
jgi:RimJ/RimL family protein N-acetyltransferase